ncbi:MAG TPA: hypothetical protein VFS43_13795 [Polyangiaceae bacterium]|nr:hypothetical protein [Polyangiaceae bacterium]
MPPSLSLFGRAGSRRPCGAATRPLALALALALGPGRGAGAEPKQARACADAHYEAQKARDEGKLLETRRRLVACSQEGCPRAVSRECAEWLVEVEKALPSLVLKAVDARGGDVFDVEASENGERIELRPDGKAFAVDPGPHVYRFEHGGQAVEERVLVREGEQRRALVVTFDRVNVPPPAPPPRAPGPPPAAAPGRGRHLTAASVALGGVGVAALGAFAFFGATGRSDYRRLRDDCGRSCAPGDVDDVRGKLLVADLSLGVGVVSLAAASVLWLTSADPAPPGAAGARRPGPGVALVPAPGGAFASVGGAF